MAVLPPALSDIPDIITDVLCRLPVKSLLRFRSASKSWCSDIDSLRFVKLHLQHSLKTNTNRKIILRDCDLSSIDFDSLKAATKLNHPIEDGGGTEILGSCNGLLALFNGEEDIALWNPSIRKHCKLPVSELEFPNTKFCICQFIIYGFGYDSVNDDYKLVRLAQFFGDDDDSFDSEVKVYSLKSDSWRRIKDFPYYLKYKRAYGILVSDSLHWVVSRKPESDTASLIVAFDLCSKEYREVEQPDYGTDLGFYMNVGVLGGCICILAHYIMDAEYTEWSIMTNGLQESYIDIWVMKEYGVKESWIKLFTVSQPEMVRFEFVIPVAYSKSGQKVLLDLNNKEFVWYDLERNTVENIRIRGLPKNFEVAMLVESLVPLKRADKTTLTKQKVVLKKEHLKNKKKRDSFLSEGFKLVL